MSVQVEAFEASIKGRRLRWFLAPDYIAYPPGFQEQMFTESPPFQRKILVSSQQSSEAWKLVDTWDAVFVPQTPTEWSLILSYLQNTPKPAILILTPEVQPPLAFYQKSIGTTLVAFALISQATAITQITFDATFLPPAKDLDNVDQINVLLQRLVAPENLHNFSLKDAVRDLKSAGATLVISSIEESKASLYWYYVSEMTQKNRLLDTIIQTVLKRNV